MMNILCAGLGLVCAGLAVSLGLAIKELRSKTKELVIYEGMADHYYENSKYLEEEFFYLNEEVDFLNRHIEIIEKSNEKEVAKLNDYIKCLQKQCNEYVSEHLTSVANMVGEITGTSIAMYKEDENEQPILDESADFYLGFEAEDKDFGSCFGWGEYEGKNFTLVGINTVDHFNEQRLWMMDYLNKEFCVNLRKDAKTIYTLTLLHEIGHYMDYKACDDINSRDKEQYAMVNSIEYSEEQWKAYRQVTGEYNADKWAIKFMLKHFPELAYSNDEPEVAKLKALMNIALEEGNFDAYDEAEQKLNELNK